MRYLILLLALLFVGCSKPITIDPSAEFVCRVRPIVVDRTGWSEWTDKMIQERIEVVNPVYKKAKIQFEFLPTEHVEMPVFHDLYDEDFYVLCQLSKDRAEQTGELAIYFVYKLTMNGMGIGGLSNFPSNLNGSIYQHGIVIGYFSYIDVVAHELGHSYNLPHPWSDKFTDTPSDNQDDCNMLVKYCNIMSYCNDMPLCGECEGQNFSDQQIAMARQWAACYPRNQVTTSNIFTSSGNPVYTNSIEPAW